MYRDYKIILQFCTHYALFSNSVINTPALFQFINYGAPSLMPTPTAFPSLIVFIAAHLIILRITTTNPLTQLAILTVRRLFYLSFLSCKLLSVMLIAHFNNLLLVLHHYTKRLYIFLTFLTLFTLFSRRPFIVSNKSCALQCLGPILPESTFASPWPHDGR